MANNVVTLNLDNTEYSFRPYGVCETSSGVSAKTVSMPGFTLFPGATICVNFLHSNTAKHQATTLNINSTGSKPVVGSKLTNAGVYEFVYDGSSWNIIKSDNSKTFYLIDLSDLSSEYFYPVIMDSLHYTNECEIHSPSLGGANPYNQNAIHFLLTADGYSDTPKSFKVLSYGLYTASEITIGAVGYGNTAGEHCVWLRGGLKYDFFCTTKPILYSEGYSSSEQVFMPGTNYYGGENTKVTICWSADDPRSEVLSEPASSTKLGGIKTGYTQSGKNYPVLLTTDKKAYVNVPWLDKAADSDLLDGHNSDYFATKTEQDNLASQIQALSLGLKVVGSANPSTIFKGNAHNITITATVQNMPTGFSINEIKIGNNNATINNNKGTLTESNVKLSGSTNSKSWSISAKVNGIPFTASASVSARYPIFYGMDENNGGLPKSLPTTIDYSKMNIGSYDSNSNITDCNLKRDKYRTSARDYSYEKITNNNNVEMNFFLLVPSDVTQPTGFTMGGAPFVMNDVKTATYKIDNVNVIYYVYKSGGSYPKNGSVTLALSK